MISPARKAPKMGWTPTAPVKNADPRHYTRLVSVLVEVESPMRDLTKAHDLALWLDRTYHEDSENHNALCWTIL